MLRLNVLAGAVALTAAVVSSAHAATVVVPLSSLNTLGSPYGTDLDSIAPSAGPGGSGFGSSSYYASVSPSGTRYVTLRVNLAGALGHSVTVGDLDSFSYVTDTTGQLDWRPSIYTAKQPGDTRFYHSRIQATPTPDGVPGFNTVSSSSLSFFESNLLGGSQTGIWSWAQIQAGTNSLRDFRNEQIMFIDFTLGANSGGGTEAGSLDGVTFNVGGDTLVLDLEATAPAAPLPAAILGGSALLGALGLRRNRIA